MNRCIKLSISVCLILTLISSAKTITPASRAPQYLTSVSAGIEALQEPDIKLDDPNVKTYILNPVDTSNPTFSDTGDLINGFDPLEAWFAFDLSSIPDTEQIISATFSAYFYNGGTVPSWRELWYYSDDSWISIPDGSISDPGDSVVADEIVGTLWHEEPYEEGYVWKTITITYDGWANDIADGYISLMVTGGQYGAVGLTPGNLGYTWGVEKAPELAITVLSAPKSKVYSNIFDLGPEEILKANDLDIDVGTYSVPSFADWNNDGVRDLIVGTGDRKVRIYLNTGTDTEPLFSESANKSFFARSGDADLYCYPSGCMGCFPRVVYWDDDDRKDLLVGQSDGTIKIFCNINTDEEPIFDYGTLLVLDYDYYTENIDIGSRATPSVVDWDNDGRKDLVCGALDGNIYVFINKGTDTEPVFQDETLAEKKDGFRINVPSGRSSPVVLDLDFDGKKDILTGNTNGQLLLYINTGSDKEPVFSDYRVVDSNEIEIDLPGTPRSRPFVCYWDEDGYPDVLIGAYDGKIHLYRCKPVPADLDIDGDIDFTDWALFTPYWGKTDCGKCGGADLNNDGKVDIDDVSWIAANWLLSTK